ncbi:unnamed protein product [Heligmosomoides polygyrus]|uniref:Retrotransposon gag protein n=1 Tax=Heligmosomoides polygyrus TaxID=6339 RepID=A0A183FUW5_HELPZ|nr:unnamed protein product [Heligmosomoides polygyrus]
MRSASFLFDTPYVDDPEKHNIQNSEKLGSSNDREARAEINAKVHQENLLERFPYLKLIQPLGSEHYVEIEANLQCDHERRRTAYMERSKSFHQCLKELGLADRLPGRIYDDMTHITDGLPMERQVTDAELEQLKENLHVVNGER